MFVSCDKCKYDSGDKDSTEEIAEKVNKDGGKMIRAEFGWDITCPNGHDGDEIHMD